MSNQNTCNQSYYRITGKDKSPEDGELDVRCAGESVVREPFARKYSFDDYELIYMIGGSMIVTVGGVEYPMKKGDVLCRAPGVEFSIRSTEDMQTEFRYYWIHFERQGAEAIIEKCGVDLNRPFKISGSERLMDEYENLFSEFRMRSPELSFALSLAVKRVLLLIGRQKDQSTGGKLDRSLRYIHSSFRHKINIPYLASLDFLGETRYRILFREHTGMSPVDYITLLRIEKANDLLGQGDMSIAEVGDNVGYSDVHYFQKMFKKCTGLTPGEYRENLQNSSKK